MVPWYHGTTWYRGTVVPCLLPGKLAYPGDTRAFFSTRGNVFTRVAGILPGPEYNPLASQDVQAYFQDLIRTW